MPLFKPYKMFYRATDITPEFLHTIGIKGLALDADNTLSEHHSQTAHDGIEGWLRNMESEGIKLMMVSNARARRVVPFANKLGLKFTSTALKPLPFGFWRAAKNMNIKPKELAAVGDQLFTDIMGANLAGVKPLLVTPIKEEDGASFKLRRRLEKPLIKRYEENGL